MKISLPIKSFHDIEEFLTVWVERVPEPPKPVLISLTSMLPHFALALGSIIIGLAVVPFLGDFDDFDIFAHSQLYTFNIMLLRFVLILVGIILITSFNLLSSRRLRGWYNLFYLSIFHLLFLIIMPNPYSFIMLLLSWYVLINIRKSFVS